MVNKWNIVRVPYARRLAGPRAKTFSRILDALASRLRSSQVSPLRNRPYERVQELFPTSDI
jgi:hypothetical protein